MAQAQEQYVVTGLGDFPEDMLRYDRAAIVAEKPWPHGRGFMYLIQGNCTKARWQSFMWTVMPVRKRTPAGDSERGPVITEYRFGDRWEKW